MTSVGQVFLSCAGNFRFPNVGASSAHVQLYTQHPRTSLEGESCSYVDFEDIVEETFCVFTFLHQFQ